MDPVKVEIGDGSFIVDKGHLRFIMYNGGEAEIQDMSVQPYWGVKCLGNLSDSDRFSRLKSSYSRIVL